MYSSAPENGFSKVSVPSFTHMKQIIRNVKKNLTATKKYAESVLGAPELNIFSTVTQNCLHNINAFFSAICHLVSPDQDSFNRLRGVNCHPPHYVMGECNRFIPWANNNAPPPAYEPLFFCSLPKMSVSYTHLTLPTN